MKQIGITTTIPIEVFLAAGYQPVDINNLFITFPNPERLVNMAEQAGFPLNCCSWIKGIYGTCISSKIDTVVCVTTGDCSNSIMLMEVLKLKGINIIPFAYPGQPDVKEMRRALTALAATLGTTLKAAQKVREKLAYSRGQALLLDEMTWLNGLVTGYENHLWLVSISDFNQDYKRYSKQLGQLLKACLQRKPYPDDWLRLAYIGVPSVFGKDLYKCIEDNEARVVFNEVQRQFAMPFPGKSLAEQYTVYTYPYSIYNRIEDIKAEIIRRRIDGVIHYAQAFCHRGIADIIIKESLTIPVLTIEGNQDFYLTQHMKTRIEAFLDMVRKKSNIRS